MTTTNNLIFNQSGIIPALFLVGLGITVLFGVVGVAAVIHGSGRVSYLKTVSAGYTGCLPDANEISNVNSGRGTWNATCQGKVYLCSAVGNDSHCAPAVK